VSVSRFAVAKGDEVVNVVLWDAENDLYDPGEQFEVFELEDDSPVSIGWSIDEEGAFHAPLDDGVVGEDDLGMRDGDASEGVPSSDQPEEAHDG
jgi:hypothetical protein